MTNDGHRTNKRFMVESSPDSQCFLCYDNTCVMGVIDISKRRKTRVFHYKGNAENALTRVQKTYPNAVVSEFKVSEMNMNDVSMVKNKIRD